MYNIATLNTAGLGGQKIDGIRQLVFENDIDILLIQETHLDTTDKAKTIDWKLNCRSFWSFGTNTTTGVGICIFNTKIDCGKFNRDLDGRVLTLDIDIGQYAFRIINVYFPHKRTENRTFPTELDKYMTTNRTIIMGGDFNNIENRLDQTGGDDNRRISKTMTDFKTTYGLKDAYRKLYTNGRTTTHTQIDVHARLDRFYIS